MSQFFPNQARGPVLPAARNNVGRPVRPEPEFQPSERPYYYTNGYAGGPEQDESTLASYWSLLRRRKGTVLLIAVLTTGAAWLWTLPQPPIYRADTAVEVQTFNQDFLNTRAVSPTSSASNAVLPDYEIQTQTKLLQTRAVMERALATGGLEQRLLASAKAGPRTWLLHKLWPKKASGPPPGHRQALAMVVSGMSVRPQPNTRVLDIHFEATDPKLAADMANALASAFAQTNEERRWATNQYTRDWLSHQISELKAKLEKSENQLQAYARAEHLLFTDEKDNVDDQRLKDLQNSLAQAQADRMAREARFDAASDAPPDALPEVLDNATLKDYRTELTTLKQKLAEMSATMPPAYPKVQALQAQVNSVQAAFDNMRSDILKRIRNEYEGAQHREKLLASSYAAQVQHMSGDSDKVAHYNIMRRDVDSTRALYETLLQRQKEADMLTAMKASNIQVVDPAQPPARPYKPNLALNLAFGLMTGLMFGIGYVVLRERGDQAGIREPGDAAVVLNVPELGVIPSGGGSRMRRLLGGHVLSPARVELTTLERRVSPVADSFRNTLASILFAEQNGVAPRVIAISSAHPAEGKTTVMSNLGIALAQVGRRVLLIDGDMRMPRLHSVFEVDNSIGLADILSGSSPIVFRETKLANLFVLPGGRSGDTSLLFTPQLKEMLGRLRSEFDMILVDTPPLLNMPDARMFARQADAVVLVVRVDRSSRNAVRLARQRLQEDGSWVLGTILNDWTPRGSSADGYSKYYRRSAAG